MDKVLLLEPFCVDSHKLLVEFIEKNCATHSFLLPPRKWHWKARTSALYLSQEIPDNKELSYRTLFTSSVLNLAELVALRPDLSQLRKVIYFHENQLVYPVKKQQDRDFQYGYNQILSCLVADVVIFNSHYNMASFLESIPSFLNMIPDHRPKGVAEQIRAKCRVIYLPLSLVDQSQTHVEKDSMCGLRSPELTESKTEISSTAISILKDDCDVGILSMKKEDAMGNCKVTKDLGEEKRTEDLNLEHSTMESAEVWRPSHMNDTVKPPHLDIVLMPDPRRKDRPLHIVWPHRWEHDKNPEMFFAVLFKLQDEGFNFSLSVLGGQFMDVPAIFEEAKTRLKSEICHWGYQASKESYYRVLKQADVVVSTANHEFFGIAMLEAAYLQCYPLCPNRLAYPEIFPKDCLYNTQQQLYKRLREFCKRPWLAEEKFPQIDFGRFSEHELLPSYQEVLSQQPTG